MARETRAQREARLAAEQEANRRKHQEHYMPRLLALLESAFIEGFALRVEAGRFVLSEKFNSHGTFSFAAEYNDDDWFDMERLYQEINYRKQEREEQAQRAEAKRAALAKLTANERDLLGL